MWTKKRKPHIKLIHLRRCKRSSWIKKPLWRTTKLRGHRGPKMVNIVIWLNSWLKRSFCETSFLLWSQMPCYLVLFTRTHQIEFMVCVYRTYVVDHEHKVPLCGKLKTNLKIELVLLNKGAMQIEKHVSYRYGTSVIPWLLSYFIHLPRQVEPDFNVSQHESLFGFDLFLDRYLFTRDGRSLEESLETDKCPKPDDQISTFLNDNMLRQYDKETSTNSYYYAKQ